MFYATVRNQSDQQKATQARCRYNQEAFESSENINLEQLLAGYQKTLQCCKVCLKHDTQAQETVKWHNEHLSTISD